MGFIGILIVAVLIALGIFVFRGANENQQSVIEEGTTVIDEAERLKSRIESRNNEIENEN